MIKVFASEMHKHALGPLVREYVIYRMRNPDPGSTFDQLNKEIRHIDDDTAIGGLLQNGYEGILFVSDSRKEVVGDTFFHLRGEGMELHLFACKVHERQRKQGIGTRLVKAFFEHSWQRHIRKVRVSKGNHEYAVSYTHLRAHETGRNL